MMLRQLEAERKFCQQINLPALQQVISTETIRAVLHQCGKQAQRERKLCQEAVVWLLIASTLFSHLSLGRVLETLTHGLRLLWPGSDRVLPGESALTYRRYQLGVAPFQRLFALVCRPLATSDTPGAFLLGLRLMALDGHKTNLPDTPDNVRVWGKHAGKRGLSAWPQVAGMYLSEVGTHAIVDAGFWPVSTSEYVGAARLLRSLTPGMLGMWDRGLYAYELFARVAAQHAHVVCRLSSRLKPERVRLLNDGTWLVRVYPSDAAHPQARTGRLLRLLTYTLDDPARPGFGQTYRLLTSLLDAEAYPALPLCAAYHQRWEIEITFDEIETHQQHTTTLLRSRKPVGVLQELYAFLLAHYAVRALMHQAAAQEQADPRRLSFVGALPLLRQTLTDFALLAPVSWPMVYARLLHDLAAQRLPPRRTRCNPRVVKRKMSNFDLKRPEHRRVRQPSKPFQEAIVLI